jgi:RimJ/RimL family protein N-acetyltransferase
VQVIHTPRGPVTLRPTAEADAEAYRALRLEALERAPSAFGADYDQTLALPPEHWREQMRRGAGGPQGVTYVACAGADLVGIARLSCEETPKTRHYAHIYSVYVTPGWRGHRLAEALLETCAAWAGAAGVRALRLTVNATNTAALRCYLRCGFSVCGLEPESLFWDGVYYDELIMVRRLAGARPAAGDLSQ